jgi:integrase
MFTSLKTEASRTNLPLPEEVLDLLREWHTITPYNRPADWVFASPYTRAQRPYWPGELLKKHIKPVASAAGLPRIGWHSFRHTVSAWGKEAGLELEDVKTLLRHEDIATTSNVYGNLGMDAKRRIQQRLVKFVRKEAEREKGGIFGSVTLAGQSKTITTGCAKRSCGAKLYRNRRFVPKFLRLDWPQKLL